MSVMEKDTANVFTMKINSPTRPQWAQPPVLDS
jgi:hypothetical protein